MTDWAKVADNVAAYCNARHGTAFEKGKFTCAWCMRFNHAELPVVQAHERTCTANESARGFHAPQPQVMTAAPTTVQGQTGVPTTVQGQTTVVGKAPEETSDGTPPEVARPPRSGRTAGTGAVLARASGITPPP